MWYIYTVKCYSAIKKNEIVPLAAAWMDLESVILYLQNRKRLTDSGNKLMVAGSEEIVRELGKVMHVLVC